MLCVVVACITADGAPLAEPEARLADPANGTVASNAGVIVGEVARTN